jgi:hypothetical protein
MKPFLVYSDTAVKRLGTQTEFPRQPQQQRQTGWMQALQT